MPENCLNSVQMDSMFLRRHRVLTVMLEDYEIAVFMVIPQPICFESCGCTIVGSVQGHVARAFEQHDQAKNALARDREIGLDGLWRSLPIQIIV